MTRSIPVIRTADLQSQFEHGAVLDAVSQGLVDLANGRSDAPMPGLLLSNDPPGDCHIKFARSAAHDLIIVKAATGFYRNGSIGLPVNDGLVSVFSGSTGQLRCVIDDGGVMTGLRTAATGVIATRLGQNDPGKSVGIVGTGYQARLQASWAAQHSTNRPIQLFGRSRCKADALAVELASTGIQIEVHAELGAFAAASDTIILCTNASSPILTSRHLKRGHHIVSLGADGPGKFELADDVFGSAHMVVVDDIAQARNRSDFASALRNGVIGEEGVQSMGNVLSAGQNIRCNTSDTTIIALCGSAACDLAVIAYMLGFPQPEGP